MALRLPWWTLQTGFEMCKSMAELSGSASAVRDQLDDSSQTKGPLPPGIGVGTKTDSQVRCRGVLPKEEGSKLWSG